jgi:hypothetical protein
MRSENLHPGVRPCGTLEGAEDKSAAGTVGTYAWTNSGSKNCSAWDMLKYVQAHRIRAGLKKNGIGNATSIVLPSHLADFNRNGRVLF